MTKARKREWIAWIDAEMNGAPNEACQVLEHPDPAKRQAVYFYVLKGFRELLVESEPSAPARVAHSMSEHRRLTAQGVTVEPPAPASATDWLGRCLCGLPAVTTVPVLAEGMSLPVCARHQQSASATEQALEPSKAFDACPECGQPMNTHKRLSKSIFECPEVPPAGAGDQPKET